MPGYLSTDPNAGLPQYLSTDPMAGLPPSPAQATAPAPSGNLHADFNQGALKSILNTLTGVYDFMQQGPRDLAPSVFGQPQPRTTARELLQPDPSNPSAPTIVPTENEGTGYALGNLAQFLAPTPAGMLGRAAQTGALTAAQGGSAGEVATSAATAGLLPPVLDRAAGGLSGMAVRQYERALGATREGTKAAAERIAPEMIERGVTGSIPSLAARGADEANKIGGQIRAAYDTATQQGVLISTGPALQKLDALRGRYVTTGQAGQVVTNPQAVQRIDSLRDMLTQIGPQATPNQLWQVRMNLDEIVGGAFDTPAARSTAKEIAKVARQGLQGELDKADPAIRALNREFGIWKDLEKVAGATERRRVSQEMPLSTLLGGAFGAGTGFMQGGGDFSDAAIGGLAMGGLARAAKTPYARTNAAVALDRGAGALSATQSPIAQLLAALFGGAASNPR